VAECRRLLATQHVGRLAVVRGGRPDVFPVNYALGADGSVVIRTDQETTVADATQRWVAFEVDEVDPASRTGWSVVVHGLAFDVTETLDPRSVELQALAVDTWSPGPRARRLAISATSITGKALRPTRPDHREGG
jgi:nitroimidazol reductase NimA-like FMN-containing flavoprotein (pyridoxamine 5'-phosphate oxidase superfamily)